MKIICDNFLNLNLEKEWKNLESHSKISVFQKYDWLKKWYECEFKNIISINIIKFYDNQNNLVMIFPLCILKRKFLTSLEWCGGIFSDFKGPIISEKINHNFFLDYRLTWDIIKKKISTKYDIIILNDQKEFFFNKIDIFKNFYLDKNRFSYIIKLEKSWDEFYNLKNAKTKETDRRKLKKLKKIGDLLFETSFNNKTNKDILMETIKNKNLQFKQLGKIDNYSKNDAKNFYLKLLDSNFQFHSSTLKINNDIIASSLGVIDSKTYYYLINSFSPKKKLKILSPGTCLLKFLIKWCFENKINIFDFGNGDEKYKNYWSNHAIVTYQYYYYETFLGFIFCLLKKIKNNFYEKFFL